MGTAAICTLGRRSRAALLVVGWLFIGCACAVGPSRDLTTGVEGTVSAGPTCPVEREGQPCPPSPVAAARVDVLAADGRRSAQAATDARGQFSLLVAPGRYTLHVALAGPFPACPDTAVTVPDEGTVTSDVVCDSGIR
jgi:acetyl esterase/lipase